MKIFCIVFAFFIIIVKPAEASFEEEIRILTEQTGSLSEYADGASSGKTDFNGLWEYIKKIFFGEFKSIAKNFPSLFSLAVLFSLKNCVNLDKGISEFADFSFLGSAVILTSGIMQEITDLAKSTCEALGTFVFTAVPCLSAAVVASGNPVSASKGAFIILGSSNVLSFLINSIFFPVLYIIYILSVASVLIKNDIFESVKKTVLSVIKISLPFLVGIFTAVLTVFMKTSSQADGLALKSAQTAIGNIVPFLGNILAESAAVVINSVGIIKSQMGILGIFGILSVLLLPVIKMLCAIFAFKILSVLSCFLTDKKTQKFYDELAEIISIMAGMAGTMAIMMLIGILILMG